MPGLNCLYRLCRIGSDAADAVRPAGPFGYVRTGRAATCEDVCFRAWDCVRRFDTLGRKELRLAGGEDARRFRCGTRLRDTPYGASGLVRMGRYAGSGGGRKVPSHFGWALRGAEPVSRPAVPARFSPSPAQRCFPKCFFRFGTDVRRPAVSSDGTFFRWDDVPEREPACRKGPQGNSLRMRACMRASPQRLSGVSP